LFNYDMGLANVLVDTPLKSFKVNDISGQGVWKESPLAALDVAAGAELALLVGGGQENPNDASFYLIDRDKNLAPFVLPFFFRRPNQRPQALVSWTALSDCRSVAFDAGSARDSDGSITDYAWSFGDGQSATGTRV